MSCGRPIARGGSSVDLCWRQAARWRSRINCEPPIRTRPPRPDRSVPGHLSQDELGTLIRAMGVPVKLDERRFDFSFPATYNKEPWTLSMSAVLSENGKRSGSWPGSTLPANGGRSAPDGLFSCLAKNDITGQRQVLRLHSRPITASCSSGSSRTRTSRRPASAKCCRIWARPSSRTIRTGRWPTGTKPAARPRQREHAAEQGANTPSNSRRAKLSRPADAAQASRPIVPRAHLIAKPNKLRCRNEKRPRSLARAFLFVRW